jgi:hypothetical protein
LILAGRLYALGDKQGAARLLETALLDDPGRSDIRVRFESLLAELTAADAGRFRGHQEQLRRLRRRLSIDPEWVGILIGMLALVLGAWLSESSLIGMAAIVVAGSFSALLYRIWGERRVLRWRGSTIDPRERPIAYVLCLLSLAAFALLFVLFGLRDLTVYLGRFT